MRSLDKGAKLAEMAEAAGVEVHPVVCDVTDTDDTMFERAMIAVRRRLPLVHYVVDCLVWLVALPLTTFSRYDFTLGELELDATVRSWGVAIVGQGVFGLGDG